MPENHYDRCLCGNEKSIGQRQGENRLPRRIGDDETNEHRANRPSRLLRRTRKLRAIPTLRLQKLQKDYPSRLRRDEEVFGGNEE